MDIGAELMNKNSHYKKARALARALGAPPDDEIFHLGGLEVSSSQLHAWRVGADHPKFRAISDEALLAYLDGLIAWANEEAATK